MDYEYKKLVLTDGDRKIVVKEPMFKEFLELQRDASENKFTEAQINEKILNEYIEGHETLNEHEIKLVLEKFIELSSGTQYMDDIELVLLSLALYYRLSPQDVAKLPASWGMLLLSEVNTLRKSTESVGTNKNVNGFAKSIPTAEEMDVLFKALSGKGK